jgi:hypothetical protein
MSALPEETMNDVSTDGTTDLVLQRKVPVNARLGESGGMQLSIDETELYINVPIGSTMTITYDLVVADGQTVIFDQPPITVSNSSAPAISRPTNTQAVMHIDNTTWQTQGASFYYTIHAIWVQSPTVQIPIRLDPTVHNDPPS